MQNPTKRVIKMFMNLYNANPPPHVSSLEDWLEVVYNSTVQTLIVLPKKRGEKKGE